jgi:hypothetical protein
MLDDVTKLLEASVDPFNIYYQAYICSIQDALIDAEVSTSYKNIHHQPELFQIKQLQSLLSTL